MHGREPRPFIGRNGKRIALETARREDEPTVMIRRFVKGFEGTPKRETPPPYGVRSATATM